MQMQALVLTADQWLSSVFGKALTELGMEAQIIRDAQLASNQIGRAKFDTVVLDFDTVSETSQVLGLVRSSRGKQERSYSCRCDGQHTAEERVTRWRQLSPSSS